MQTIAVSSAAWSYPIHLDSGILERIGEMVRENVAHSSLIVITNDTVDALYGDRIMHQFKQHGLTAHKIIIPDGERFKTLQTYESVIGQMLRLGADRQSVLIAAGGGVVGDLAGFAAATFMRGIRLIQVPTTLLAQVDASVGGKVGVNHELGKNMIGAFHQPEMVIIDPSVLKSLPQREIVCGLAEVIKHALILDRDYFATIRNHWQELVEMRGGMIGEIILRSCQIKAEIVRQDEKESGIRALLNFGHTIGHAIEALGEYNTLKHGEAVLIGMMAEAYISLKEGFLPQKEFEQIYNFIREIPLSVTLEGISTAELEKYISKDKKTVAGEVRMVLLRSIGEAVLTSAWKPTIVPRAVSYAINSLGLQASR